MNVEDLPTRATMFGYRGRLYEAPVLGDGWVGLAPDGEKTVSEEFPDAVEVVEDRAGTWVKVPRSDLESAFTRHVRSSWKGVPVELIQNVRQGPDRGRVLVWFAGDSGAEAEAAGFRGSDYGGWEAAVDPSELAAVQIELVETRVMPR
jgi:hypothetical protein